MAKRGRKPKHRIDWAAQKNTFTSAVALGLLLLAVISTLSIFAGVGGESAAVNSRLRNILVTQFGFVSILLPIIFFYLGLLIIGTIRWKFLNYRIFSGITILFIGLLGLFGKGLGGELGGALALKTSGLVSMPGSIAVYITLTIFSIVVITGHGISGLVEKVTHFVEFIGQKFFGIKKSTNEKDPSEIQLELPEGVVPGIPDIPDFVGGSDTVVIDEDDETTDYEYDFDGASEEEIDKSFKVMNPPTGPVEGDRLWGSSPAPADISATESSEISESDSEISPDSTDIVSPKALTELARLPFSNKVWEYPSPEMLSGAENKPGNAGNVQERAKMIEETLKAFGVKATIADVHVGPAVTQYALNLSVGTKANKIQNLSTDLALRLKSPSGSVRVVAPIPGTNLVGIEVPNFTPSSVSLRSVLESKEMKNAKSKLAVGLGHDVAGKPIVQDLAKWPHALIAGATGSGKSVMINSIISTLLMRCSPSECRFIMIDPKMVELSPYNGIPHLLTPVVTDVEQKAVSAFAWAVYEMERRYKLFANAAVRNLDDYNRKSGFQAEPYIIIVVDEIADMMMVAANEIEKYIIRLAQKSRATGIHLVLATQRPSVNIITGTIKANVPTRLAFKVTSNVDSRVIIDQAGAETLIGRGDMLFVPPDDSKPVRIQGAYMADDDIPILVDYLKNLGIEPDYKEEITEQKVGTSGSSSGGAAGGDIDEKTAEAIDIIISDNKASASYLQRKLGIGYSRAARIIDDLEDAHIVGGAKGSKPRDVLVASADEAIARLSGEVPASNEPELDLPDLGDEF